MLWIIDTYKKVDTNHGVRFYKVNLETGEVRVDRDLNQTTIVGYKEMANSLFKMILKHKPSNLVIEKTGVGLGLYDALLTEFKNSKLAIMQENGELYYKG